jgi:dihydrofolate reductase
MPKLIYTAITSLDGFVADEHRKWEWSSPSHEVHAFINDLERGSGTLLLGRRMYDVLVAWETMDLEGQPEEIAEYKSIWLAADKVVYSRSLEEPRSERTRIERSFDAAAISELKASASSDISVGGPEIAAQALAAGVVDEIGLLVSPVIVGGGNPALPSGQRIDLALLDERRFANGVVHLRYAVTGR